MDDRVFDDLARAIGRSVTRKTVIKLLGRLSVSGFTSLAGTGGIEAKKHHKHKHKHKQPKEGLTCQEKHKDAVCHCPNGLHGSDCRIQCEDGLGHKNDPYDCLCFDANPNLPRPLPLCDVCPPILAAPARCVPNCSGSCQTLPCPNQPHCDCVAGQCVSTCSGNCSDSAPCPTNVADCVCNRFQGATSGTCGAPLTCDRVCISNAECPALANCVCNRKQGQDLGLCGLPQTCGGPCDGNGDCLAVGNCVCNKPGRHGKRHHKSTGECGAPLSPPPPPPPSPPP